MADTDRGEGPTRSSYARVARSTSTPLNEVRASAKRWTAAETRSRVSDAPMFRSGPPSAALLDQLVQEYQRITGDHVRTPKKRNFLAACYRVHGADVVPYIAEQFADQGTAQNLLGIIRFADPRGMDDQSLADDPVGGRTGLDGVFSQTPDHVGLPCPIDHCLPDLIYCGDHFPPFDPTFRRRYDRHPSNPDAVRYFADQTDAPGYRPAAGNRARAK